MAKILSNLMVHRHLGEHDAAKAVDDAIAAVIAGGKTVRYDLREDRDREKATKRAEMADAVIAELNR